MKKTIFLFLLLFSILSADQVLTVQRNRGIMRIGPGSYFPVLKVLEYGDNFLSIGKEDGWYITVSDGTQGYISQKVTQERASQKDIFAEIAGQDVSTKVSRHGMTAGVKGFGERFTQKLEGNPDFVDIYLKYNLDAYEFLNFKKRTYQDFNNSLCIEKNKIPAYQGSQYFTFSEIGFGIGIASQISSLGLYKNRMLQDYINRVANLLVLVSENYDNDVKVFILDSDLVNAYACPGGIIFVTKGMLGMVESEAELACVLAHELAHINRRHGLQELEERKEHLKSDAMFAEMESEFEELEIEQPQHMQKMEEEMEELAFNIYQTVYNGRLAEYEEEADFIGAIYAARAGYNSSKMLKLLLRLQRNNSESTNQHYTQEQLAQRYKWLKQNIKKINLESSYLENSFRWVKMKELLK
ncbi:MAG: M48 family metallopeptidase [Candidatus Cloacimonadota bacterium]|nr:M48 family metallopeptidase [Candidatus Cloacimonadota bacterium]